MVIYEWGEDQLVAAYNSDFRYYNFCNSSERDFHSRKCSFHLRFDLSGLAQSTPQQDKLTNNGNYIHLVHYPGCQRLLCAVSGFESSKWPTQKARFFSPLAWKTTKLVLIVNTANCRYRTIFFLTPRAAYKGTLCDAFIETWTTKAWTWW